MNFLTIKKLQGATIKYLLVLPLILITLNGMACEICGCSINGYHFGILPQFSKNVIGLKYHYRTFRSQHLLDDEAYILGNKSAEYYNSAELWGRFYVTPRLQLFAFIPVNHFTMVEEGMHTTASGLGDITIAANYTIFNTAKNDSGSFSHSFQVGGGIKLPTGKFSSSLGTSELNPGINTGTGAFDYLVNAIYNCRFNRFGMNTDASYRINSTNNSDFRYGGRFTTTARFFYWKDAGKKTTILPNAGLMLDLAGADQHMAEKQTYSGGHILSFTGGLELYTGRVNVGFTFNQPLSQKLSKGLVKAGSQFSASLSYMF